MKTPVICGLDTDDSAPGATAVARAMAQGFDLPLLFVHVTSDVQAAEESVAGELLRAAASDTTSSAAWTVESGHPADCLVELAQEHDAAFVVVGCHGPRSSILGSVSSDVSRRAPCPVVIVPPGAAGSDGVRHGVGAATVGSERAAGGRRHV